MRKIHKVSGRSGQTYIYAWRGGPRIKAKEGTLAFEREVKQALAARNVQKAATLEQLIDAYLRTPDWASLRVNTRRVYGHCLDVIRNDLGNSDIDRLQQHGARGLLLRWRDEMAVSTPQKADLVLTVLNAVMNWAVDREIMLVNPIAKFKRLKKQTRRDAIWSDDAIAAFMAAASPEMRVAMRLAVLTGQRQSDMLALRWSQVGDVIHIRQQKTGNDVAIPVQGELASLLASIERKSVYVLTNTHGQPWSGSGFRAAWNTACKKAGIGGLHFHDLRGTFIAQRYAEGWSISDIAAVTGHTERGAEQVIRKSYMPRTANVVRMERRVKQL